MRLFSKWIDFLFFLYETATEIRLHFGATYKYISNIYKRACVCVRTSDVDLNSLKDPLWLI